MSNFCCPRVPIGRTRIRPGSKVAAPLMHGMMGGRYFKGADLTAAELPYDGHELSMVLLVPEAGGFEAFEDALQPLVAVGPLGDGQGVGGRLQVGTQQVAVTLPAAAVQTVVLN